MAVFTSAFAWVVRIQLTSSSVQLRITYLFDSTDTDIEISPCRLDLATPKESNDPDGIFVSTPPPDPLFIINFVYGLGHPLNDVPKPSYFLLYESNVR